MPQITYYAERATNKLHLAYRRDLPKGNETEFYNYIESERPRYLMLSVFEVRGQPEWVLNYPQTHPNRVNLVQVYSQGDQPVVAIYELIYHDNQINTEEIELSGSGSPINNTDHVIN